nr:sigma-70 factor domain-containing protein [Nocardia bovistercoris]
MLGLFAPARRDATGSSRRDRQVAAQSVIDDQTTNDTVDDELYSADTEAGNAAYRDDEAKLTRHPDQLAASVDSVRDYLEQIGKVALLTADEEVDLSIRIEVGLYAAHKIEQAAGRGRSMDTPTRRDLPLIARAGTRAKNAFIRANLRLVVAIAKHYTGRGLTIPDDEASEYNP